MVMLGWQLGSIEAILIAITAGFSVDYVVHLAHAMVQKDTDVDGRIRESFREMGVSVFSGMFTSVGASIFLFSCQLRFFYKFGVFLCSTIAFSWLFANFWLPTLVKTFGIGPFLPGHKDSKVEEGNFEAEIVKLTTAGPAPGTAGGAQSEL
eukprot:FR738135.1.p1 GENE.FR738135.1~~FR738135.1.p1  ORF type:complete len:164 (+),score=18.40 FR738135.1:42-494(+)